MTNDQRCYIVQVDSFAGEDSAREQYSPVGEEVGRLYAIVIIADNEAEIIDDGYLSRQDAKKAWPQAL
jgi:hypothetical protein